MRFNLYWHLDGLLERAREFEKLLSGTGEGRSSFGTAKFHSGFGRFVKSPSGSPRGNNSNPTPRSCRKINIQICGSQGMLCVYNIYLNGTFCVLLVVLSVWLMHILSLLFLLPIFSSLTGSVCSILSLSKRKGYSVTFHFKQKYLWQPKSLIVFLIFFLKFPTHFRILKI